MIVAIRTALWRFWARAPVWVAPLTLAACAWLLWDPEYLFRQWAPSPIGNRIVHSDGTIPKRWTIKGPYRLIQRDGTNLFLYCQSVRKLNDCLEGLVPFGNHITVSYFPFPPNAWHRQGGVILNASPGYSLSGPSDTKPDLNRLVPQKPIALALFIGSIKIIAAVLMVIPILITIAGCWISILRLNTSRKD